MDHHDQVRIAECGSNGAPSCIAIPRRGLTLIELLVTIVIMVTVLAGALPLLSPNNNTRKIREASRQLTTLFAQAQAQAARDGRPVGVEFRESIVGNELSGMAQEAYLIAEPPAFTGFSEHSRVTVMTERATYGEEDSGNPIGNGGTLFSPKLYGKPIFNLQFSLYGQQDPVPPRMIRIGDVLNIEGNYFIIVDDRDPNEEPNAIDPDTGYAVPAFEFHAVWLNNNGQLLSPGGKTYSFRRQPTKTAEQPLQLPRGIGVDLEASGADGIAVPNSFDNLGETKIGVMFSPNGSVESLYRTSPDGTRRFSDVSQLYILLGLIENGNGGGRGSNDYNFIASRANDAAELAQRRAKINWLNADCRWVTINRAGRIITADNNVSYDPNSDDFLDPIRSADDVIEAQYNKQIQYARQSASNMNASTGR